MPMPKKESVKTRRHSPLLGLSSGTIKILSHRISLFIHLAAWAELGVITRAFVTKFFSLGCSGQWGPCLEGGIYFSSLPANMLGCFIIGVFAASSAAGLANNKNMVIFPESHSWQHKLALQTGIRTGYCGSLTTFSSWMLDLMQLGVNSNLWVNAIVALAVGLCASIISYIIGIHVALYIDRWLISEKEDVLEEELMYRRSAVHAIETGVSMALSSEEEELEREEPDIPRLIVDRKNPLFVAKMSEIELAPSSKNHLDPVSQNGPTATGMHRVPLEAEAAPPPPSEPPPQKVICRTDIFAIIMLLGLTIWGAVGTAIIHNHQYLTQYALGTLFGPIGCILRWYLSRYNYKLSGLWAWFPIGTFAANMIGTALIFGLETTLIRCQLSFWPSVVISAVQLGVCGSLTTVSTFITELVKFSEAFPDSAHAYIYGALTFVGGIVLGFALYSWAIWV